MEYETLKELDRENAIQKVTPEGTKLNSTIVNQFPEYPDVIVFGGNYWKSNELISDFIDRYIDPKSETDISSFLQEIAYRIVSDPGLAEQETRKNKNIDYQLIYRQHYSLYRSPDMLFDWSESKGTFIWFEHILPKRRQKQFAKIIKDQDDEKLTEISDRIKKIYNFSDLEIIYLQYFCSQTKLDDLDPSLNTVLYLWSKEKMTGKTTISEYICSFLNGECKKNADAHKSNLGREMQLGRFDIPTAINSRCTILDEAGFHDMTKVYDKFKSMITSNTCEVEYKYKSSHRPKKCHRNYLMTSNFDPIIFVKDEEERRILSIHFTKPEQTSFEKLEKIWHEFVFECNFSKLKLESIYQESILPNSQAGDIKYVMMELKDILSKDRITACTPSGYFSVSNIMLFPEIITQKTPRNVVKEVLMRLYGEPDKCQRFYKGRREIQGDVEDILSEENKKIELPF